MAHIDKTVFISYRRVDSWQALAVFKDLTQHGYDVFIDYDGIASGDFERAIVDNIWARAHFILLLTPTALMRCDNPADWMRREIEVALDARRNIVPLLLDGFSFEAPLVVKRLQGSLEPLRRCNALRVPEDSAYFDTAMGLLRSRYLAVTVDAVTPPASAHAQQVAHEQQDAASKAAAVIEQEGRQKPRTRRQGRGATHSALGSEQQSLEKPPAPLAPQPPATTANTRPPPWALLVFLVIGIAALVWAIGSGSKKKEEITFLPSPPSVLPPAETFIDPVTQNALGDDYYHGRNGRTQDDAEAVKWYRKAAEQGAAFGQANLGSMYEQGRGGLAKDDAEAVKWYRKAADQGNARGQGYLAVMYEQGRGGLAKDDAEAVKWYRKAAEQGYAPAQADLGRMYLNGSGLARDDAEAVKWYRKAADQGNAWGQGYLGSMYEQGRGGLAKDDAEAVKWYRKAADQGNAQGQGYLAVMYEQGRDGLAKDESEAVKWYRKAAEQGYAPAQADLGRMYLNGSGLAKDDAEAVKWYRKAAEQEHAMGNAGLGFMYEQGRGGLAKDQAEAVKHYRKAAEQGDQYAKDALKRLGMS